MTIVVCLKASTRTDIPLRLTDGGQRIQQDDLLAAQGAQDFAPLATALALAHGESPLHVTALAVGPRSWEPLLRKALAMGAADALRIWREDWDGEDGQDGSAGRTGFLARAAAEVIAPLAPKVVLVGDKSRDGGHECFGAFLAQALGAPLAHRAVEIAPGGAGWRVRVKIERGYSQEMALALGAVVTLTAQQSPIPYPSLPAWLAALRAGIPSLPAGEAQLPGCMTILRPPVPRVKRYTVPPDSLPAEERINAMVALPASSGGTLLGAEMDAGEQAAHAARLLRECGYV
ncbi:MAG: hypothetical protein O7A69_15450 [SAR324 cluster bacterium]|nr:hypothetical protein [SAR324 cluster bacterium]